VQTGKKVLQTNTMRKILNPKHEIPNKHEGSKSQCSQQDLFEFGILDLGFV
jgi:hypothetical protein